MAHYAKILNGIVTQVIVAEVEFFDAFIDNSPGEWIQTSYNTQKGINILNDTTPLRKNFAGIGYSYNKEKDAFIPPKPFESWIINEETYQWDPPIPYPIDGEQKKHVWDEESKNWKELNN